MLGLRLSISSSLVFYKKKTASKIIIDEDLKGQARSHWKKKMKSELRPSHNAGMCKTL